MLLLSFLCACSKVVDLQSGLKDADANEMVTVLNRHGVDAQKRITKEGVALSVKDTDISCVTEALNAAGLISPAAGRRHDRAAHAQSGNVIGTRIGIRADETYSAAGVAGEDSRNSEKIRLPKEGSTRSSRRAGAPP